MNNYHIKEQEKHEKERRKGSAAYLLISLGIMTMFIPVAIITVGSMKAYKQIREVLKR